MKVESYLSIEFRRLIKKDKQWNEVLNTCVFKCLDKMDDHGLVNEQEGTISLEKGIFFDTSIVIVKGEMVRVCCIALASEDLAPRVYVSTEAEAEKRFPGKVPKSVHENAYERTQAFSVN